MIKSEKVQNDKFGTRFLDFGVLVSGLGPRSTHFFSSVAVLRNLLDIGSLPQVED